MKTTVYKIVSTELYGHLREKALKEIINQNIKEVEVVSLQDAINTINPDKALLPKYWKYFQGENNENLTSYMNNKEKILALPAETKGRRLVRSEFDIARINATFWNNTYKQWESEELFEMMEADRSPEWAAYLLSHVGHIAERPLDIELSRYLSYYYKYQELLKKEDKVDAVQNPPDPDWVAGGQPAKKGGKAEVSTQKEYKSITDWYLSIYDKDIREKALENLSKTDRKPTTQVSSIQAAIAYGFEWNKTPEGYKYWHTVQARLTKEFSKQWQPLNSAPETFRSGMGLVRKDGIIGVYKLYKYRAANSSEVNFTTARKVSTKGPIETFTYIPNSAIDKDLEYIFLK